MKKIEQLEDQLLEMKHKLAIMELEMIIESCAKLESKMHARLLSEGFIDNHDGPAEANWDKIRNLLDTANRALGFVNKLKNKEQKKEHLSRVFRHINTFARQLVAATNELPSADRPGHMAASHPGKAHPKNVLGDFYRDTRGK